MINELPWYNSRTDPDAMNPIEREMVRLICLDHTSAEMAGILNLKFRTVERYRAVIAQKLDVHSPIALVRRAILRGLFSVDEWREEFQKEEKVV